MGVNYKALELKLRTAMESAIEKGWAPMPVVTVGHRGTCCAIGSLLVDDVYFDDNMIVGDDDYEDQVSKKLRVPVHVVSSVWKGFDNRDDRFMGCDKKAFAIGANIRRIYCDDNGQVE